MMTESYLLLQEYGLVKNWHDIKIEGKLEKHSEIIASKHLEKRPKSNKNPYISDSIWVGHVLTIAETRKFIFLEIKSQ